MDHLARILNPNRMRYPYFIGAALWLGWIVSLLAGSGNTDAAGHLIGTDFVAFYTAGKILLYGQSSDLYNLELARQIQQPLYSSPSDNFNPYLNPPFYAWLFIPFALLPYPFSPILWMLLNLFILWAGLKSLFPSQATRTFILTLTWLPSFAAISFGQNAFLSLFLLSLTYVLWREKKYLRAGLVSGLLLYKPQLLLGIGLLWMLNLPRSWRAIVGLTITGGFLLTLSYAVMPEATLEYYSYTQKIAANLMRVPGFPIWNAHSIQSFWLGLFPEQANLALIFHILIAVVGIGFFIRFWQLVNDTDLRFGAAVCLTVWITPYIMIYDWVLLILPAVLFWRTCIGQHDRLKSIYAILWVVMLFSSALTFVQWSLWGRAVQLSIPILLTVLILSARSIIYKPEAKDLVSV